MQSFEDFLSLASTQLLAASAGRFAGVAEEWEDHCRTLGCPVTVRIGARVVRGRGESLDDDGALLVRTEHGRLERITGGDLTLEKEGG